MGQSRYKIGNDDDYITLLKLNQTFVDTVRNIRGKNSDRLLIIVGMNQDPDLTYKLPIDPSRKLAISLYYFQPLPFAIEPHDNLWTYYIDGERQVTQSLNIWGSEYKYKELFIFFQNFKEVFADKGYPVIISEVWVLTEDIKEINSIREYLYFVFSKAREFSGIMSFLWDTSNKKYGIMSYYVRVNDKLYDEIIRDIFKKISKGKYLKFTYFSFYSNKDTSTYLKSNGNLVIKIGKKKIIMLILGLCQIILLGIILLNRLIVLQLRRILMVHTLIFLMLVKKIILIMMKFKISGIANIQLWLM